MFAAGCIHRREERRLEVLDLIFANGGPAATSRLVVGNEPETYQLRRRWTPPAQL